MALFDNCLLASDIDGTLVDTGYISPRNIEAINFFRENGGTFVLSTGRSASALGQVFGFMDKALVGPCVVLNGGMIYDFKADKPLYAKELTYGAKEYVKTVKEKLPDVGIEVHSNSLIYVLNRTEETELHEDYELLDREYVTFNDIKDKPWHKILYTCDNRDVREKLIGVLTALDNNDCFFVRTEVTINSEHHLYLEQLPFGTTKAKALKELCKILGIKKGGLFAIGDYFNDVEMLSLADIAATPCESPQEIKKLANFVGGRCRDGAVADFIEYLTKTGGKKMDATKKQKLSIAACKIRRGIIDGVHSAKAGHPGGSLSIADLLAYLYFDKMNIDPADPKKADRDRLVLSKGHAAPALYSALAHRGFFPVEELLTLRHTGARLQGHPDMKHIPGVDMSSGSLGQGISCAVGMALSAKHFGETYRVYTVLGDGECEEGQVWEAAMFAANKGLSNLTAFVDFNNLQIDGTCDEVNSPAPLDKKFEAFGWNTVIIDGHNLDEIEAAVLAAEKVTDKPTAIIMNTVKGKGVSFMENQCGWHGKAPGDEDHATAVKELEAQLAALQ